MQPNGEAQELFLKQLQRLWRPIVEPFQRDYTLQLSFRRPKGAPGIFYKRLENPEKNRGYACEEETLDRQRLRVMSRESSGKDNA